MIVNRLENRIEKIQETINTVHTITTDIEEIQISKERRITQLLKLKIL